MKVSLVQISDEKNTSENESQWCGRNVWHNSLSVSKSKKLHQFERSAKEKTCTDDCKQDIKKNTLIMDSWKTPYKINT